MYVEKNALSFAHDKFWTIVIELRHLHQND